jgi:hypothetical protein
MRSARILLSGVGGLLALFLIFTYPRQTVVLCATSIAGLVLVGFLIPVPRWIASAESGSEVSNRGRLHGNAFPRLVVFETEIRSLWLLIVSPLYAMGVATLAVGHFDQRWHSNWWWSAIPSFFSIKVGQWITAAAVCFAWWWFQERLLLRKAEAGLGFGATQMGEHGLAYQYFDADGERRGGTSLAWGPVTHSFPVFIHANNPEFSKPGFGFLFHRFSVMDAKDAPSSVLELARIRILARATQPN